MNVTDLASYRSKNRRDDRAQQLLLWRSIEELYADLCEAGLIKYDQKVLKRLWEEYVRGMPHALRRREMLGSLD